MLKRKTNIFVTILFTFVAFMLIGTTNVNAAEITLVSTEDELKAAVDGKTDTGEVDTQTTYVKLTNKISLNSTLQIKPINDLTLDLNGYEIQHVEETASIYILYGTNDNADGSLTIKDSSEEKTGKIKVYKDISIRGNNTNDVDKHFTLNIEGGTFKNVEGTHMFYLYDYTSHEKEHKSTYDFNVKGGEFQIHGKNAIFLSAENLDYYNIALNLKLHKLTVKADNTRFIYTNQGDFTVKDVLAVDSKFTVKNSSTSLSETFLTTSDKETSVVKASAIKTKVGFEFDTIEITSPSAWSVSDVTYTENVGYDTAKSVSIPICNIGEDTNRILSVTVDSDNFIIEEGNTKGINSGDTDTSWKIKAKPGLARGTYTATITLTNRVGVQYKATVTLKVIAKSVAEAKITGVTTKITYGNEYTPKLSSSPQLDESDYTVKYQKKDGENYIDIDYKPTDVGEYKVYIRVTNSNYILRVIPSVKFEIVAKEIELTVSDIPDQTYTGGQIIPEVSVTYNGTTLTKDVDYKVAPGGMNQDVGTGKITIKPVSGKNYTFDDIEKEFKIVEKTLTASDVILEPTSFEHTGSEITPAPAVKHGGKTLTKGTDYELSYSNNIDVGENTATVIVTGNGNYTGTVTKKFSITSATTTDKKRQSIFFGESSITKTYGDSNFIEPVNQTLGDGAITYESTDPEVATVDASGEVTILKAGTTTIKATASETDEYKSAVNQYELTVNKKDLSFTATIKDKEYDGNTTATLDSIVFTGLVGNETLTEGTDYEVTDIMFMEQAAAGDDVSTYVAIRLKNTAVANNYKLASSYYEGAKANITPKAIKASWITVNPSTTTYNGSEIKPSITLEDGAITLTVNTDYTVEYLNNTNAGTGKIKVTGKGNYSGEAEKGFTINPKGVSLTVADIASQTYTGEQITPGVFVSYDSAILEEGTDYTVEYGTNIDAGTGTATVKPVVGSNYTFGNSVKTFSIVAKTLEESNVTLAPTSYTHTGSAIKPEPVVKDGDTTLVKDTDYTLSYANNTDIGTTATVKVTRKGNYTGEVTKTFSIVEKSSQTISFAETEVVKTYGDDKFTITANHSSGDGTVTYTSINTDVATVNASGEVTILKVGTAKIKATAGETENYTEATAEYTLTVNKKELSFIATVNNKVFDNNKNATVSEVIFTGLVGSESLTKDTDYTVSAEFTSANVGNDVDVNVTITLQDTGITKNYKLVNTSYTAKANITGKAILESGVIVDTDTTYTYNGSEIKPDVIVKDGTTVLEKGTHYTVEYSNNINAGTGKVKVTGIGNYSGIIEKEFTINPKTITLTINAITDQTYTGEQITPGIIINCAETLTKGTDYTVVYGTNIDVGTGKVTIKAVSGSNYTFSDVTQTFYIVSNTTTTKTKLTKVTLKESSYSYTGSAISVEFNNYNDSLMTKTGDLSGTNAKSDYSITIALKDTANYEWVDGTTADLTLTWKIEKATPTIEISNLSQKVGSVVPPTYTVTPAVTDGTKKIEYKLSTAEDSTYIETLPTEAGTYNVKVSVTGDKNLNDTSEIATLTITKKTTGGGGGSSTTTYAITVKENENAEVTPNGTVKVEKGADKTFKIKAKEGYEIEDVLVDGKSVGAVSKYTFENVKAKHTLEVKVKKAEEKPTTSETKETFKDVKKGDWYFEAVEYVAKKGLMNGTGNNEFSPDETATRGMIVTILYRLEGEPAVEECSFTDVPSDAYYAKAIAWAEKNGIVLGLGEGKFGPDEEITREQLVAIMYRYSMYKKYDTSVAEDTNILSYNDIQNLEEYAFTAMQYACGEGLITGVGNGNLDPKGNATRAQVATILMRYCEKYMK